MKYTVQQESHVVPGAVEQACSETFGLVNIYRHPGLLNPQLGAAVGED